MAQPTAYEQYVLELINKARANPTAQASSLGVGLNDGLPAGTISGNPEAPLAFSPTLTASAQQHSGWMLANNTFSHYGPNNESPSDRMAAAGYQFTGSWMAGENIAMVSGSATLLDQATALTLANNLFVSPEHRENILNPNYTEDGAGFASGNGTVMLTQDFAASSLYPPPFITGVAYNDTNSDNFYEPGEGLGGTSLVAKSSTGQTYSTATWTSGGYELAVPAGTYQVTFSGGALATPFTESVTVGSQNVEADMLLHNSVPSGIVNFGTPTGGTAAGGTGLSGTAGTGSFSTGSASTAGGSGSPVTGTTAGAGATSSGSKTYGSGGTVPPSSPPTGETFTRWIGHEINRADFGVPGHSVSAYPSPSNWSGATIGGTTNGQGTPSLSTLIAHPLS